MSIGLKNFLFCFKEYDLPPQQFHSFQQMLILFQIIVIKIALNCLDFALLLSRNVSCYGVFCYFLFQFTK